MLCTSTAVCPVQHSLSWMHPSIPLSCTTACKARCLHHDAPTEPYHVVCVMQHLPTPTDGPCAHCCCVVRSSCTAQDAQATLYKHTQHRQEALESTALHLRVIRPGPGQGSAARLRQHMPCDAAVPRGIATQHHMASRSSVTTHGWSRSGHTRSTWLSLQEPCTACMRGCCLMPAQHSFER